MSTQHVVVGITVAECSNFTNRKKNLQRSALASPFGCPVCTPHVITLRVSCFFAESRPSPPALSAASHTFHHGTCHRGLATPRTSHTAFIRVVARTDDCSREMKGWLAMREGMLSRTSRFYFRLQWGFLSKHLTETSASIVRYFVHGAIVTPARTANRLTLDLARLGVAFARHSTPSTPTRLVLFADDAHHLQTWLTCLLRARDRDVRSWYSLGDPLGEGSDGVVLQGVNLGNGRRVAVKKVALSRAGNLESAGLRLRRLMKEIQLQHKAATRTRYVAEVLDVFYDEGHCYIIVQLAGQGSLSELLERRQGALGELFVRRVAVQLGRCMLAMHQCSIVHRDIKCDNVLLDRMRMGQNILLCDFGFAAVWRPENGRSLDDFCKLLLGTESYLAPELLREERYGAPADVFAMGVVMHVCLTGTFPFPDDRREALRRMMGGELSVLAGAGISEEAKSFCRGLLHADAERRLTAAGLLQHRWLRGASVKIVRRRVEEVGVVSVVRRVFYVVMAVVVLRRKAWLSRRADRRREVTEDTGDRIPWLCGASSDAIG